MCTELMLRDMETHDSPYKPTLTSPHDGPHLSRLLVRVFGFLTTVSAILFALLLVLKPDLERHLRDSLPGRHMPDAFAHLNDSVPIFVALATVSLAMLCFVTVRRQYSLVVPLIAGPAMSVLGWFVTEEFEDPNWFHFFAVTVIGMLVSCLVVLVLAVLPRKQTKPGSCTRAGDDVGPESASNAPAA